MANARGSVRKRCSRSCTWTTDRKTDGMVKPPPCPDQSCGSWAFTIDLPAGKGGQRRQIGKSGFPNREAAVHAMHLHLDTVGRPDYTDPGKRTTGAWLEDWLAERVSLQLIKGTTAVVYRSHLNRYLVPWLGHIPLSRLSVDHINEMIVGIRAENVVALERKKWAKAKGPRLATINTLKHVVGTLQSALTTAEKRRLITHNPAKLVEWPATEKHPVTWWSAPEMGHFLDHVHDHPLSGLWEMYGATGARRGELLALTWADVVELDPINGAHISITKALVRTAKAGGGIHVSTPKTRAGVRIVQVNDHDLAVLRRHRDLQRANRIVVAECWEGSEPDDPDSLVFTDAVGRRLDPSWVTAEFGRLAKSAELRAARLHDLRHSHIAYLLSAGVPLVNVSKRVGHSNTSMTSDRYGHLEPRLGSQASLMAHALIPRAGTLPSAQGADGPSLG